MMSYTELCLFMTACSGLSFLNFIFFFIVQLIINQAVRVILSSNTQHYCYVCFSMQNLYVSLSLLLYL